MEVDIWWVRDSEMNLGGKGGCFWKKKMHMQNYVLVSMMH